MTKIRTASKDLWESIISPCGSPVRIDDIPERLLGSERLQKVTYAGYASGSVCQPDPGFDVFRSTYDKKLGHYTIDKDHYQVIERPTDILIIGPLKDGEHHLGEVPDRLKKIGNKV